MSTGNENRASGSTVDVVVVGSLNADFTTRVGRHPRPGETVLGTALAVTPGGKGANQAVAAARLGATVGLIGRVGDDSHGELLRQAVQAEGVCTAHLVRDTRTPTGIAMIAVAETGENSIIVSPGANTKLSTMDVAAAGKLIGSARVMALMLEVPVDTVIAAARAAHAMGTRVVLNLSPVAGLPADVLAAADPLIVNEHEARQLLAGTGLSATAQPGTGLAAALCHLGARSAVVTLGERGAAVAEFGGTTSIAGIAAEAVDTTGAGDAFAGALAWRLSRGDTLPTAARYATRVSAFSVRHPGAQPSYPTLDAVPIAAPGVADSDPGWPTGSLA